MENITIFGDGYMDETVDMLYYSENDITNPKFLGNIFPLIGRDVIEKFYEYGIMGENKIDDFDFLENLNEFRETYEIFNIIPLTSYTILIGYWFKRKKYIGYLSNAGRYKKYITSLINGINRINLSEIDFNDVLKFDSSNTKKIMDTKKIKDVNNISVENIINYLLHILPQYLTDNVKLDSYIFNILNKDEDEISFNFRNLVWDKSHQYLNDIKTKNQFI